MSLYCKELTVAFNSVYCFCGFHVLLLLAHLFVERWILLLSWGKHDKNKNRPGHRRNLKVFLEKSTTYWCKMVESEIILIA